MLFYVQHLHQIDDVHPIISGHSSLCTMAGIDRSMIMEYYYDLPRIASSIRSEVTRDVQNHDLTNTSRHSSLSNP